jgi:N-acetylneuraminic acid mutarotase
VPDARADAPPAGAPAAGEYGTRATLLAPNSEFALAAVGTKLYVLGGYPSSRVTQDTLQIYDVPTNAWRLGPRYPFPVHHPVTVGVNGKLYSLGGQTDGGDTNRVFEYDPGTDMWRELARMPTARGGGAGAAIGDKIYVVGGRPPANNAFEVYDIGDNAWMALPRLPTAFANRNHLAAGAIGGKIYVAGGRYNGGGFGDPRTDALDMYDPATNAWTSRRPMLRPRGGMSSTVAHGCFFVYGGEGQGIGEPNDVYPDHDVYNPATDTWTALRRLAVPFHGVTGGAFVDGLIYMPGGGTRSGGTSGSVMHQVYRPAMRCDGT